MFDRLKSILTKPEPAITADDGPRLNVYATIDPMPARTFPHITLGEGDRSDPELSAHLDGFIGYVLSRGDGQMTHTRYHLMRHLQRVRHQVSLRVPHAALPAFAQWAQSANAVVFHEDGGVRDPWGRVLIDGAGDTDPASVVPHPEDAQQRKHRSEILLASRGITVAASLPPLLGQDEVRWQEAGTVTGRLMALLVVSTFAEGLRENDPVPVEVMQERLPEAFAHLSPKETAFLSAGGENDDLLNAMGWRYESLALLAWAVGVVPSLPFPGTICDVPGVCAAVLDAAASGELASATRRPTGELLDALDLHYRIHWAVRDASLGRRDYPADVIPGVVLERHYALNWLSRFEDAAWDDVDTPT